MNIIAKTPQPPYYAVIFSSIRAENNDGYTEMANLMIELAHKQAGFWGVESARNELGITVSYWKDLESIHNWKKQADHQMAQKQGQSKWYKKYKVRIARVERDYGFEK